MGKVVTKQELLFRPLGDLPPTRRALLALALNPNAPEDVLLRLAALPEARRILAAREAQLSPRLLDLLLAGQDPSTLRELAANPATPWAVLREFAERSDDSPVRGAATATMRSADDPEAAADLQRMLRTLATDPDADVRAAVAGHPQTPVGLDSRSFPPFAWVRVAAAESAWLRREACRKPDLPADAVGRLARDPDARVRAAAARHPNLPEDCVADLVTDPAGNVAESMGKSPALSVEWMYRLLDEAGC